ncbi:hypothetical protein RCH13_002177 [Chryseobacterium sp. MP_3.2]|nr:hypothetical protein [Chryseobacterium sp. MP_3.2]
MPWDREAVEKIQNYIGEVEAKSIVTLKKDWKKRTEII